MPSRPIDERRVAVLEMVARYLAVREQPPGSNRSPEIDRWLTMVGSPLRSPWCSAFLYGCGVETLGTEWPFLRSGRVQDVVDACEKEWRTAKPSLANPGELVAFWFPKLERYAHIGIVRAATSKVLQTIEGNTIADGATGDVREGWGVFEKRRVVSDRMLILTWPSS
jgi:hypothetical protein